MSETVFPYDDEVVDPYSADDTKNPHEETEGADPDEDGDDGEAQSPPKRRPGRPRKNPE